MKVRRRVRLPSMHQGNYFAAVHTIFPEVDFPDWDPEGAFRAFKKVRAGTATEEDRNQYVLQIMQKIGMECARQGWIKTFEQTCGSDNFISTTAYFILERSNRFNLRRPWEDLSDREGSLALIATMNTVTYRRAMEQIRTDKSRREVLVSEHDTSAERMDNIPATDVDNDDLRRLIDHLSEEETIDRIAMRCPGDVFALEELIKNQVADVAAGRELVAYEDLRPDLRGRISTESHSLCTSRIVREIEEFTSMVG